MSEYTATILHGIAVDVRNMSETIDDAKELIEVMRSMGQDTVMQQSQLAQLMQLRQRWIDVLAQHGVSVEGAT